MNYKVSIISVESLGNGWREFTALIDGIEVKGKIKLISGRNKLPAHYRLYLPKVQGVNKHPSYRKIREKMLVELSLMHIGFSPRIAKVSDQVAEFSSIE